MSLQTISRRTLVASAVAATLLPVNSHGAGSQQATFPLVVSLDWLRERSDRADLRLIDVSPLHTYRNGHIDSATHAWWRDTVDPNYPVFGAVLTQGDEERHRQRVLDSLGIFTGDDIVVYDNTSGFRAARLVWFLRFVGFGRAALLDAGYDEWKASEFPIVSVSSTSTSPVVDPQPGYYLVTEQVLTRAGNPEMQLIDIRTDSERDDDLDGNMPHGQIPGSVRLPWSRLIDASGHLLSSNDLLGLTGDLGLDPDLETILYGRFGVDTALSWLALRNAGFATVLSYDRGWAEWSSLPDLPREPLS